ncbi:MAG: leucine-rich repeat protein [Clostridia bacterium]|nr:leucine-rich repeat protein [Clostridia bacterium]
MKIRRSGLFFLLALALLFLSSCACNHENVQIINSTLPTCTSEGYTGDQQCIKCEEITQKGEAIALLGHNAAEAVNITEPSCISNGYTGDVFCSVCNELLEQGKEIPALGHSASETRNAVNPTCSANGYTGDVFCAVCNELLEQGKEIPALDHSPSKTRNATNPTCTTDGYTGDVLCTTCGEVLEPGTVIPASGHRPGEAVNAIEATCLSEGYTGDCTCTVCSAVVPGIVIEKLPHTYENNVCSACEWRTPGVYLNDTLAMTWEEILAAGFLEVKDGEVKLLKPGLKGLLVVNEGVTSFNEYNYFISCDVEALYLPSSFKRLEFLSFHQLKYLRTFGLEEMQGGTMFASHVIEEVVLNEGLRALCAGAFRDKENLKKVHLPSSLNSIGSDAFENCYSLTEIDLPETLTEIGNRAFRRTALKSISLPASVQRIGGNIFSECKQLVSCDLSQTQITELPFECFTYCAVLKDILLPSTLTSIEGHALGSRYPNSGVAVEHLDIPEGVSIVKLSGVSTLEHLKTIVWPVSLTEFGYTAPALETIFYRGNELQWQFVAGTELYEGTNVIFNYQD